jgi:hypothetical protein
VPTIGLTGVGVLFFVAHEYKQPMQMANNKKILFGKLYRWATYFFNFKPCLTTVDRTPVIKPKEEKSNTLSEIVP